MSSENELFSIEAEEAVIGAVLINQHIFTELGLEPGEFYYQKHSFIWQAFNRLYSQQEPMDNVTVADELERADKLKTIGGPAYLTKLINHTPSSLHAEAYARTVKEFARRRAWRDVAEAIAKVAYDKDSSLELEASGIVDRLLNAVRSEGAATHISYYTAQVLDEVATRRKNPADVWGIPTGFSDFDYITGGLQLSEILYISGEPGVGKSIMADQMGFQMAEAGYPGAIYSLEMPGKQVVRRRFSFQSKVQMRAIKTGRLDDEQYESLLETASAHDSLPLYMSDSVMWTTASLRADLARLKTQYGIQWFVLDYAYLLQDGRNMSENDRTGLVSAYLKAICRSLNIAGIVIHSLNKSGMGGDGSVPTGQNLRGSGQQFYDTDLLLFLVKSENPNSVMCVFGKGRELDNPKQAFQLHKFSEYPAMGNAVASQNGRGRK